MNISRLEQLLSQAKFVHADDAELGAFTEGRLPEAARGRIEAHLGLCAACQGRLEFLRELLATPSTGEPSLETLARMRSIVAQPRINPGKPFVPSLVPHAELGGGTFDLETPSYGWRNDELAAAAQPEGPKEPGQTAGVLGSIPPSIECPLPEGGFLYGDFEPGEAEELVLELRSAAPEMRGARVLVQFQGENAPLQPLGEVVLERPRAGPGEPVFSGLVAIQRDRIAGPGKFTFRVHHSRADPDSSARE